MQLVSSGVIETQVLLNFVALSRSMPPNVFCCTYSGFCDVLVLHFGHFFSYFFTARAGAGMECAYQPQRLH
jgi:hypothetical protein